MSERITEERLAEIEVVFDFIRNDEVGQLVFELHSALEAERRYSDDQEKEASKYFMECADLETKLYAKHFAYHKMLSSAGAIFKHYEMIKPGDKINTSFLLAVAKRVQELEEQVKQYEAEYELDMEQAVEQES